jgi:hypothetical protein
MDVPVDGSTPATAQRLPEALAQRSHGDSSWKRVGHHERIAGG